MAIKLTTEFKVGQIYTARITYVPPSRLDEETLVNVRWSPAIPGQLSESELADYSRGMAEFTDAASALIGHPITAEDRGLTASRS
jgi:hypothetical protein